MADVNITATTNVDVATASVHDYFEDQQQVFALQLKRELEDLMENTIKPNFVPVDTGALRDSGTVGDVEIDSSGNFNISMTFGNESVFYAIFVHEDLTAHHPHGQAKYLEVPLRLWVAARQ